jgi:phasin family protein
MPFAADESLEQVAAFNGAALDFFSRAGSAYFKGVSVINDEVAQFVSTRLDDDAEFGQSIAKCHSWSDAAELQQDWVQKATRAYFTEAGKLFEMASKMTIDNWKPIQEQANKTFAELNKPAS